MRVNQFLCSLAVLAVVSPIKAEVIIDNTFESYSDQAAFDSVFDQNGGTVRYSLITATDPDTGANGSTKYLRQEAGTTARSAINLPYTIPTTNLDENPISVEFFFRSSYVNTGGRVVVGLVDSGLASNYVYMGTYNGNNLINGTTTYNGWYTRVSGVDGGAWNHIGGLRTANTWQKLKFIVKKTTIEFYGPDELLIMTQTRTASSTAFAKLTIGANVSTVNAADIDNVKVSRLAPASVSDWNVY